MTKRILNLMLISGLGLMAAGTAAAADPDCDHGAQVPQPVYGSYGGGNYAADGSYHPYGDPSYAPNYTPPVAVSYAYTPEQQEPAPGTYWNGYVWMAGAYAYPNGVAVWVPGHWEVARREWRGGAWVDSRAPRHYYRTARSYRWRSRW
jgi:WXXGXW repeat (2 copies)